MWTGICAIFYATLQILINISTPLHDNRTKTGCFGKKVEEKAKIIENNPIFALTKSMFVAISFCQ
ncbi:MAG: hypothetical protein K6E86_02255 [Bacteroidales bacterium]|nr:hypothetical protein [Bacteroidales bacterium]